MEYSTVNLGGRKKLPLALFNAVKAEIKMILHAHRDCLRNRWLGDQSRARYGHPPRWHAHDPRKVSFDATDGYYGEAFGMLRCLVLSGYGQYGPVNIHDNVNAWFDTVKREVLAEEGFGSHGNCDHCMERYYKDDSCLAKEECSG